MQCRWRLSQLDRSWKDHKGKGYCFNGIGEWKYAALLVCCAEQGMGGAMDLVSAPNSTVLVTMEHTTKDGAPRIMEKCDYPLTGSHVVDRIITDMGVFDCGNKGGGGLTLVEIAPDVSVETVRDLTACDFKVSNNLKPMSVE